MKNILLSLALLLSSPCAGAVTIAAFGDSLSAGYGLPEGSGFAPVLERKLKSQNLPVTVVNAAVSGDTTSDALLRTDWMLRGKPDLVIVEFGANDMFRGTPLHLVEQNLSDIVERIKQSGAEVLLAGMQAPKNYAPEYRQQFADIYQAIGDKHQVPLYTFFLEGVALDENLNLQDGIHPNARGVEVIVDNIAPMIADMVEELL